MRACKSVRRVVSGATALMLAMCMVMCAFASFVISSFAVTTPAFATDADRSYASWSEVSKAIDSQLQQGQSEYKSGNNSGAATRFQAAYNSVYVASNMITVVQTASSLDANLKVDKPNVYAQKLRAQIKAERKSQMLQKRKTLDAMVVRGVKLLEK